MRRWFAIEQGGEEWETMNGESEADVFKAQHVVAQRFGRSTGVALGLGGVAHPPTLWPWTVRVAVSGHVACHSLDIHVAHDRRS